KLLTNGLLDLSKFNLREFNEKEITKLMGDIAQLSVQQIVEEKEIRSTFINQLEDYMNNSNSNIVFFIDELDRCRPSFAIELLEVIKHLFNIKKITFVISVDKEQLSYSISTLYGQKMDSDGYLRRFFDLEYKIPVTDKRAYIALNNKEVFKEYKNTKFLEVFLRELIARDDFSFRDIDKTYSYIKLLMPIINVFNKEDNSFNIVYLIVYSYILAEMINIKTKHNSIYKKIINLNYNAIDEEINTMLNFNKIDNIKFNLNNFSDKAVKEIIIPTMNIYLKLIKLTNNGADYIR
ncbi:P-loop NTPase fold protein, partial [Clostridium botulinum]